MSRLATRASITSPPPVGTSFISGWLEPTDWPALVTASSWTMLVDRRADHQIAQGRRLALVRLGQPVALGAGLAELGEQRRAPFAREPLAPALGLGKRRFGGLAPRAGLVESPLEIAQLALDRDQTKPRIEALLGQAADRVELLAEQPVAVAQARPARR